MAWWMWILLVLAGFGVLVTLGKRRRFRLRATILVPEQGAPEVHISPAAPEADDLCLLVLCYAAKIRWVILSEPVVVQELFDELCGEAIDSWSESGGDLIDRMPSARGLRAAQDLPRAVPGGERFQIDLFRTQYTSLQNHAYVVNTLPMPGLAPNLPWSWLLIANHVASRLHSHDSERLREALASWCDSVHGESGEQSVASLKRLFALSLASLASVQAVRE